MGVCDIGAAFSMNLKAAKSTQKNHSTPSFLFIDSSSVREKNAGVLWLNRDIFFTPFFLRLNIAAPHRCSLIFMNNCLGWILAIAFTFISPHGTSSSVSQHTPPTTDPGSALHGNIILHSVAKKEVLTSALHEQQIEISALVTALCTLCAFHVLTHLKLMKLWLIGWNVHHGLEDVGGLALFAAFSASCWRWPQMNQLNVQGVLMTEQITSIYVFWIVCFLWPELKQSEGEAFVAPAVYAVVSVNRAQDYDYERNACNPFRNRFSSLLPHSVSSLPTKMKTTAPVSTAAIIISSLRHHIFLKGPVFHTKAQSIRW